VTVADVVIVPTGTANLASVLAAFRRLGADPTVATAVADVGEARRVVVPGVGSFGAAMGELGRAGLLSTLQERVGESRPTLAICVGMQVLAPSSDESERKPGLGVVDSNVTRFPDTVRVPQFGWNQVTAGVGCNVLTDGWAYFANSFRFESAPEGWSAALADHGGTFVAAMERGNVLACQFHPELSGDWGRGLLGRWLDMTEAAA
jgi:imidazole glycerol phosphate synthase glutamine amidotransferase subunit